jgi:hypothetical protein
MLFFIISYIIYNFFFNKMIILMSLDISNILHVSIDKIIKSICFFNIGVNCGKILFFLNFVYFYIFLIILLILNLICLLFYFQYTHYINILRFITGISLGIMITILIKEINIQYKSKKDQEKLLSLVINNNLFSLPLYLFFQYILSSNFWIIFIYILLTLNIIYIQYDTNIKNQLKKKNQSLFLVIPKNFMINYLPIYLFLSFIISLILFISILVLLLQTNQSIIYNKDYFFNFFELFFTEEKVYSLYNNLPIVIGSLCYFFRKILRKIIFYLIFIGLFSNYFINTVTLYTLINGLIYGIYIIYTPYFLAYVKSEKFVHSQLILYIGKSLLGFILQYFFLNKSFSLIKKSPEIYFIILGFILIFIKILIIIFDKNKLTLFKEDL